MIKRIHSDQLKQGMFIHDLNCGWMSHPFARNSFMVEDDLIISKIIASGIHELYIDSQKGLDVEDAQTHDEYHAEMHEQITALVEKHEITSQPQTLLGDEIIQAKAIQNQAQDAVHDLMSDIRLGRQIELEKLSPVVEHITDSIFRNKDAFISLSRIKRKDEYTFQHSVSVCALLVAFSRAMGYISHRDINGLYIFSFVEISDKRSISY